MKDERGSVAVEVSLSFTMFVLALVFFINLIGVVTLQSKVEYALHQTAKEVSTISYIYELTSLDDSIGNIENEINGFIENFTGQLSEKSSFFDQYLSEYVNIDINVESSLFKSICHEVFESYLSSDSQTADQYLKRHHIKNGIKGIDFSQSSFLEDGETIDLVVEYRYDYKMLNFSVFDNGLLLKQRAMTKIWSGGDK